MSRSNPKNITVEFDDGSRASTPFDSLPSPLQFEILRQPFASRSSSNPKEERYVLLEWDNGWKEVIEVDATCTDINRYYVISRPEDVGRLSLNKDDGYPELIEILREPQNLKTITFSDTFRLTLNKSAREGKKTDHFYGLSKEGNSIAEIIKDFKKAVEEEGVNPQQLLSEEPAMLQEQVERIRRKMGLMACRRQQDVFDFILYLAAIAV